MNSLDFKILDCSLQRKVKSTQNLSLIVFVMFCLLLFVGTIFNILSPLFFHLLITIILISFIATVGFSLFFIKKQKVGTLTINKEKIVLNSGEVYSCCDMFLDLNTNKTKDGLVLNKIPFWGNYIKHKSKNVVIEFEPNSNLIKVLDYLEINNSKRSVLQTKTTDLIKEFLDFIWVS